MRRSNTGWSDGFYSVPAGHVDGGEKTTDAMVREAKEETGLTIDASMLKIVHTMHRQSEEERIDLFFTARDWQGTPTIIENNKCDDRRWFPIDRLPSLMVPYVESAVRDVQRGVRYSESGWK